MGCYSCDFNANNELGVLAQSLQCKSEMLMPSANGEAAGDSDCGTLATFNTARQDVHHTSGVCTGAMLPASGDRLMQLSTPACSLLVLHITPTKHQLHPAILYRPCCCQEATQPDWSQPCCQAASQGACQRHPSWPLLHAGSQTCGLLQ